MDFAMTNIFLPSSPQSGDLISILVHDFTSDIIPSLVVTHFSDDDEHVVGRVHIASAISRTFDANCTQRDAESRQAETTWADSSKRRRGSGRSFHQPVPKDKLSIQKTF